MIRTIPRLAAAFTLLVVLALPVAAQPDVSCSVAFDPTQASPGDAVSFFGSISNDGDEPTTVDFSLTIVFTPEEFPPIEIGPLTFPFPLAAGEERSIELSFVVPPIPGTLSIDVAATDPGTGSEWCSSSATLTIMAREAAGSAQEFVDSLKNEFEARGFEEESGEIEMTWGQVKSRY